MAARAALVAGAAAGVAAQSCLEKYNCIFHHNVGSQEYSWDLHQLCTGGAGYVATDVNNHTYNFNICGTVNTLCAPAWPIYSSHGTAVQTWSTPPPCATPTCKDADSGAAVCCTGNCAVLAEPFFQFSLQDEGNPLSGGVTLTHIGMPPDPLDQFKCPNNGVNLPLERTLIVNIACDSGGSSSSLTVTGPPTEPTPCTYVISTKSKAACGVKGDPFDGFNDDPAHSFGFVVLGSVLTILVYVVYVVGDARGWWDCIKSRLPAWCCRGGGGASFGSGFGSSYSSGSAYKGIGNTSGGASAATPITASAYGTA